MACKYPDLLACSPAYDALAETFAQDSLTALRQQNEQVLCYKLPESALRFTPIEYFIIVPAVWSDSAQAKNPSMCGKGWHGRGSALHIISEPEAATMYALDAMDPHNLKKWLEKKLSNEVGWDEEILEEAMNRFGSVIKRQFHGTFGEEFSVPVPGLHDNAQLGIRRGKIRVSGTEIKSIFEPVLNDILRLVMDQIRASKEVVKTVLLVGGFGQNSYLRDSLRQEVKSYDSKIEVMQSPNGWTAIVRGALMKGLASTSPSFATVGITARVARKHYGISSYKDFVEGRQDRSLRDFDPRKGKWRIQTMDWFVKKGGTVEEDKPLSLTYTASPLESEGHPGVIDTDILVYSDPHNTGPPMYRTSPGVVGLINVDADLNRVPIMHFPQVTGKDGRLYYKVSCSIEITFYSAYTKYELVHEGINYGAVAAEYV